VDEMRWGGMGLCQVRWVRIEMRLGLVGDERVRVGVRFVVWWDRVEHRVLWMSIWTGQ